MSTSSQLGLFKIRAMDQWLLQQLLDTPQSDGLSRARYKLLRGIRRLRLTLSDPLVAFSLGPLRLSLPLSHEMPFYRRLFPEYSLNLGRVSSYVHLKYPELVMIDVGANVGDSVAMVRSVCQRPILCIEGQPSFFRLLKVNTCGLSDIELENAFLGAPGDSVCSILTERGNATIRLGKRPGIANISTLGEVLSRHPRFASAKLLKLDAEGFDCKILAAETAFIRRCKPVLFFEYYPEACVAAGQEPFAVFPLLASIGYSSLLIYQNFGRYFMSVNLEQTCLLKELHCFLAERRGYCDVVAFHTEDSDVAERVRAFEYAELDRRLTEGKGAPSVA
jgi:FkbM family methyltransferase